MIRRDVTAGLALLSLCCWRGAVAGGLSEADAASALRVALQRCAEAAVKIVSGSDTAVTEFFARRTRTPLGEKFLPNVTRATEKVSLADRYNKLAAQGVGMGLIKGDAANVQKYVTAGTLDGLYLMIGNEEKKIRADPVATGSALLKQVFSR